MTVFHSSQANEQLVGLSTGQFLVWGINPFSWSEVSNKKQLKLLANSDPCYLMLQHDPGAEYS